MSQFYVLLDLLFFVIFNFLKLYRIEIDEEDRASGVFTTVGQAQCYRYNKKIKLISKKM